MRLWKRVVEDDPGETNGGFDLAVGSCLLGDSRTAIHVLERVINSDLMMPEQRKCWMSLEAIPRRASYTNKKAEWRRGLLVHSVGLKWLELEASGELQTPHRGPIL